MFFDFFNLIFVFFKETGFVLYLKKTQKPHSELFSLYHALSSFLNYTVMTCYTYYGIQI